MKDRLVKNVAWSVIEKILILAFQLVISIVLVRNLERSIFGALAIVGGFFSFVAFLNFPIENYFLKEDRSDAKTLERSISQYFSFAFLKVCLFALLILALYWIFRFKFNDVNFIYLILSFFLVLAHDVFASPFIMLSSVLLRQDLIVKMSFIRWTLSLMLLIPLFFTHSVKVLVLKDLLVLVISIPLWRYFFFKEFELQVQLIKLDAGDLYRKFKAFTLWTHLIGSVTNVIYKVDAFILGNFVSLETVGNYNIALSAANVANIIPSILAYQNSVAISNSPDLKKANTVSIRFLRLSFYISLITLLFYFLLGKTYLLILTGRADNDSIYFYMLNIVFSLILVKTIVSPLVAYINIKGDVKKLFFRVKVPLFVISLSNYALFAWYDGARGISIANVVNALIWVLLIIFEIRHYEFRIDSIFNLKEDWDDIVYYVKNYKILR